MVLTLIFIFLVERIGFDQFPSNCEVSRIDCPILQLKPFLEPGKFEGHVNSTAKHAGAEHVLQDVRLLDGQHQAKLLLLEDIDLNI